MPIREIDRSCTPQLERRAPVAPAKPEPKPETEYVCFMPPKLGPIDWFIDEPICVALPKPAPVPPKKPSFPSWEQPKLCDFDPRLSCLDPIPF